MANYTFINDLTSFTLIKGITTTVVPKNAYQLYISTSNPQVLSIRQYVNNGYPNNDINLEVDTVNINGNSSWVDANDLSNALNSIVFDSNASSIIRGLSPDGEYRYVGVNKAGALLTADFGTEVSRGLYNGYSIKTRSGRNTDIDVTSAPEDLWAGGNYYTGHNPFIGENVEVFSSNNQDAGALLSNGTVTTSSSTELIDSNATFISDGVNIGDLIINDTNGSHGHILSIDSETQLSVLDMHNGITQSNEVGDLYRVATSADAGAAVIVIINPLNTSLNTFIDQYVILDGTNPVVVSGDFMRVNKAKVVLDGGVGVDGHNLGDITIRQETTTNNVFAVMPITGQTNISAFTVPRGKNMIIKRLFISISRVSGAAGSANIILNSRENLGSWNGVRTYDIQTGGNVSFELEGGIFIPEGTDVKLTCESVSDNSTIANGEFEFYLIDM